MGRQRLVDVERILSATPRGSLLDVGTGRGETLEMAASLGFFPVRGTEVVPELIGGEVVYAEAHALPFERGQFDVVTCFDVMEHLIADDLIAALSEMGRVSARQVLMSWSEIPSSEWGGGRDLHISRRSASEAETLIRKALPDWSIERRGTAGGSPAWALTR